MHLHSVEHIVSSTSPQDFARNHHLSPARSDPEIAPQYLSARHSSSSPESVASDENYDQDRRQYVSTFSGVPTHSPHKSHGDKHHIPSTGHKNSHRTRKGTSSSHRLHRHKHPQLSSEDDSVNDLIEQPVQNRHRKHTYRHNSVAEAEGWEQEDNSGDGENISADDVYNDHPSSLHSQNQEHAHRRRKIHSSNRRHRHRMHDDNDYEYPRNQFEDDNYEPAYADLAFSPHHPEPLSEFGTRPSSDALIRERRIPLPPEQQRYQKKCDPLLLYRYHCNKHWKHNPTIMQSTPDHYIRKERSVLNRMPELAAPPFQPVETVQEQLRKQRYKKRLMPNNYQIPTLKRRDHLIWENRVCYILF